jgi:hypothetical protein
MVSRREIEGIEQLIAIVELETFSATDGIQPECDFLQRLVGVMQRQLRDERPRLLGVSHRMIGPVPSEQCHLRAPLFSFRP